MSTWSHWLVAFMWTLALEVPVYAVFLRGVAARWWEPLALALVVNVATHPLFSVWILRSSPAPRAVLLAELAIAIVESALVYFALRRRCSAPRALAAGVGANLVSFVAGELVLR